MITNLLSKTKTPIGKFIIALVLSSLVSEVLFIYSIIQNRSLEYDYLSWNLFLSWVPFLVSIKLFKVLSYKLWSSWEALFYSFIWIVFLPNSFYMISDYIHLTQATSSNIVFDALMLTSFIYTAIVLGFSSLYLVHLRMRQRYTDNTCSLLIAIILFICSVAIYFGRDLRWSSWDVIFNPGGLLFDISDRLLHFSSYPSMIIEILAFFILLSAMYNLLWRAVHLNKSRI